MTSRTRAIWGAVSRSRLAAVLMALTGALGAERGLSAQGTQPLRKTDLVRLLTAGSMTVQEIAGLVRRNCVSFQATARDHADLRAVGADTTVLAAVDQCARPRGAGDGGGRGGGGGGSRDVVHVVIQPKVSAPAGTEATITVRLMQGRVPQGRVPLTLGGSGTIPGGLTQDALAFTDAQGVATFHVPTGPRVATYRLTVVQSNGVPVRAGRIELTTTVARELVATAVPSELLLAAASPGGGTVRVMVTDVYGNPAPGVPLKLEAVTAALAAALPMRTTDERGQAAFPIAPSAMRREGLVGVFSGDARIGSFRVRLRPLVLSEERTRFVPGTAQQGLVGTPLSQPLVFEVRDTSGTPVAGQSVSFSASAGRVEPAVASTDSSGVVRARVTLGERAGPVAVTAKVGAHSRSVTLSADPGPARELVVMYDTGQVRGPLVVRSRQPVVLRVAARDGYGNETALQEVTAAVTGQALRVAAASASGSEGVVQLEPRRQGSGELTVRAAGLETRVPVQVTLPVAAQPWAFGARGSWAGFSYAFAPLRFINGRPGVRGELFAGRAFTPQLRVEIVGGLGALKADSGSVERSVSLTQTYLRAEYAFDTDAQVMPVVSVGGGLFKILSDDPRHFVYHSSLFWLIGAGADITISPRVVGEVRLETQQLQEMTSRYVNGHVGALTIVEVGVRLSP